MQSDTVTRSPKAARTRGSDPRELPPSVLVPKAHRRTKSDLLPEHYPEMLSEARELGLAGATDFEICEHFEITQPTLYAWRAKFPAFDAALKLSKDLADGRIEASLYQKAHGYTYRSEEIKVVDGVIVRVPTVTHVPPDTTAMIFWLKNRQRANWTDQQDINVNVDVKSADVRALAMSLLATIKAGLAAPLIEHEEPAEPINRE